MDGAEVLRIARSAARRVPARGDWADLVQDAAVALLEAPDDPQPLYLARRTVYNAWRCLARRGAARAAVDLDAMTAPPDPDPDRHDSLASMMDTLSDTEATVMILVCGLDGGGGRSFGEVAWMTRQTKSSVVRRYNGAVGKLRARLRA